MNQKLKEVLGSKNVLTAFVSLILLGFAANNIDTGYSSEQWVDLFYGKNSSEIITLVIMTVFNTGTKIYVAIKQNGGFTFKWLSNSNAQSAILVIISLIVGGLFNEQLSSIIISGVIVVLNIIYQLILPPKNTVTVDAPNESKAN